MNYFRAMLLGIVVGTSSTAAADAVFHTDALRLRIGSDGMLYELGDRVGGVQRAVGRTPFCLIETDGRRLPASRMEADGALLRFGFADTNVELVLDIQEHPSHLLVTIDRVRGEPDEIRFVQLKTRHAENLLANRLLKYRSSYLGLFVGSAESRVVASNGEYAYLSARTYADLPAPSATGSMTGRTAALFAGRTDTLLDDIEQVERALGIPGGMRNKRNAANARSYLFARGVNHGNIDRLIELAQAGGFGAILFVQSAWTRPRERFAFAERDFPGGVDQLHAAVEKIHAAGMLAGAHVGIGAVTKTSTYVHPTPDSRLYKDHSLTLAQAIDAHDAFLPTTAAPSGWPNSPGARDIQLDDEIIRYGGLSVAPPYGFQSCERGVYGTKAARHSAGVALRHLAADNGGRRFLMDMRTDMPEAMAEDLARTYDAVGFDWIYFDGAEDVHEPRWYTTTRAPLALLSRLEQQPVIVQTAASSPWFWHLITREGQRDYYWVSMDPKQEVDDRISRSVPGARDNLMAAEIGWFPFKVPLGMKRHPSIDEAEYLYVKALGANAAVSILASPSDFDALPHRGPILAIMRKLEELRLQNYFPPEVRKRICQPHTDFMLVADSAGGYHLPAAKEIPFVAGSSHEVRAFAADPINGVRTISFWNVADPVWLELRLPIDSYHIVDYRGQAVATERLPDAYVKLAVSTRLYLSTRGDWNPRAAFRQARVSPMR